MELFHPPELEYRLPGTNIEVGYSIEHGSNDFLDYAKSSVPFDENEEQISFEQARSFIDELSGCPPVISMVRKAASYIEEKVPGFIQGGLKDTSMLDYYEVDFGNKTPIMNKAKRLSNN